MRTHIHAPMTEAKCFECLESQNAALLKVAKAAKDIPTVINDAITIYAPEECDAETILGCSERRTAGGGTLAYFVDARMKLEQALAALPPEMKL